MNKEFIPYEQAVDLESIGFDVRPNFGGNTSLYSKNGNHTFYTNYGVMGSGLGEGYIYAPTFSEVFRWFRSKGFVISLRSEYVEKHEYYIKWKPENSGVNSTLSHPFETYEEAELACLNKLIEIVKSKKD